MSDREPFTKSGLFERAVRRLLRPLVRALIAQNVTATAFYRIVKQTYVEVASDLLGKDATDSRISVITGVHRRDVKDFRSEQPAEGSAVGKKVSTLATVIGRWLSHPEYLDDEDTPLVLPRTGADMPSFEGLVQSISRDIRPRTVLDELLRQKVVDVEDDMVRLKIDGLIVSDDMDQKLHFFSHNVGDHLHAAVENLLADPPPHLERAVFYNNLTDASVSELEAEAREISQRALRRINVRASTLQNQDEAKDGASSRIRFGVFFFKENEDEGSGEP